jgi:hypothetical protein
MAAIARHPSWVVRYHAPVNCAYVPVTVIGSVIAIAQPGAGTR